MGLLDDAIREHLELKRRHGADSSEISRQERELFGADPAPVPAADPAQLSAAEPGDAPATDAPELLDPAQDSPLAAEPEGFDDALFPHTHELMEAAAEAGPEPVAAAPEPAPAPPPVAAAPHAAPATPPAPPASEPSLTKPAPAGSDAETAARSGARRLSEDELAAWRQRLSERADRLAAQRSGAAPAPATPAAPTTPAPPAQEQPPPVWSARTPPATPPDPGVPVDFFDAGEAERAFAPEPAPEPEPPDHDVLDDTPDFLEETPEHDRMWFEQKPPRDFDFG